MSHGIVKPIDRLFSTVGTEWHGFAEPVEVITTQTVEPLLFPIIAGGMTLRGPVSSQDVAELKKRVFSLCQKTKGENGDALSAEEYANRIIHALRTDIDMFNHKGLVADFRTVRPDLIESKETSGGLVPLHVPKDSYKEIENRVVWEAMQAALKDVDATVSCVGTLEAGRKFFVSAKLGNGGFTVKKSNGAIDKFLANLNFITSHDGTLAVEAYDSTIRVVCMNTLRWSREAAGDVGFKVYHTQKAAFAMDNLGALVNRILTGRAEFADSMAMLSDVAISLADARALVVGYLVETAASAETSKRGLTRRTNTTDEILNRFQRGNGNEGKSLYDLLNGATEYWTHGDGCGKESNPEEKAYKASFGRAADHKSQFANLLLAGGDRVAEVMEAGRKADLVLN